MSLQTADTRTRIMDSAEALVLSHGFDGTSVNAVVTAAGVTKGAFFHHFESKAALGLALVNRYAEADERHLRSALDEATAATEDPVQRLLTFVEILERSWAGLAEPYPGCLFASYVAAAQLFDEGTHQVIREAIEKWTRAVVTLVEDAAAVRPPALEIDAEAIGDMVTVIFEGSFVVAKSKNDATTVTRQVRQYRNYLRLLFAA